MEKERPIIVQSDRTIFLETAHPRFAEARDRIARFAELEKSPEHVHTYRINPLSIWNAKAGGLDIPSIIASLEGLSRFPIPGNVRTEIEEWGRRFGTIEMRGREGVLVIESGDPRALAEISRARRMKRFILGIEGDAILLDPAFRGHIKMEAARLGWPIRDLLPFDDGLPLDLALRGDLFSLRDYQTGAAEAFLAAGSGTVVLPCGAGKTIVGMRVMEGIGQRTLILVTNTVAARQWRRELLSKTSLSEDEVGEYSGDVKEIRPVTIATYQILTYRRSKTGPFIHFPLLDRKEWGLVIYDEVHLLPAPVFRMTAEIASKRRLGLTATLIREDGLERDVFSLIGPKRFDSPWKDLERQGWIAAASCREIRIPLPEDLKMEYAAARERSRFRIASENPLKFEIASRLLERHIGEKILVIGQYITQLNEMSERLSVPLITGKTPNAERERLYKGFRDGEIPIMVVSKVANFAVDLPDASVLVQLSGTFGSRQEEAQRLGRILRPKGGENRAWFYTLVTGGTVEEEFASRRQLFLVEQGYDYAIERAER